MLPFQQAALDFVAAYARRRQTQARETLAHILEMSNVPVPAFEAAVLALQARGRVALHFHPDRVGRGGVTVAESLLECGHYRNQFETGLSGGSLTAYPGGPRDQWEQQMFGGAYTGVAHRPKYGALSLLGHPDGPSPRFGSCYLLLAPEVSRRCTFTYLDSHRDPVQKGTLEEFDDVLAALFTDAFEREMAFGEPLRPADLVRQLGMERDCPGRNLDFYIEAQVHGEVSLARDVQRLVVDPSFQGTSTGRALEVMCQRYEVALDWHGGFALPVDQVPDDFRGPSMPSLARRVANVRVDARSIGEAALRAKELQELQELKRLWHVVVRYGNWGA